MVGLIHNDVKLLLTLNLVVAGDVLYHLRIAANHGKRRADIVRQIRDKLALQLVNLIEL